MRVRLRLQALFVLLAFALAPLPGRAAEWVQTNQPLWGLRNALQFAVHPAGFGAGDGGPRGLIRIGAPVLTNGGHTLVNFIAIEPIVKGRRGFSELERSKLDSTQGKRFTAGLIERSSPAPGVEQIDVPIDVERFDNGAHVRLILAQRSDTPDELRLSVHTQPDSAKLEMCILTATMGNLVRTRQLWLRDKVLSSLRLYPDYRGNGFTPHTVRPLAALTRNPSGDVLVAITGDEQDPSSVFPFPGRRSWHYAGVPVTQYWKMPKEQVADDLRVAVNARFTYWMSRQPIPGGIAFENFELNTRFRDGQQFIFGITRRTPQELGMASRRSAGL